MSYVAEDEYESWKNSLFENVDDCSVCPFSKEYDNDRLFGVEKPCYAHPDYYCPCHWMEKYYGMTNEQVVNLENAYFKKAKEEELQYQDYLKEKERRKKAKVEKSKQTRRDNYEINRDIKALRSLIRRREHSIQSLSSYIDTFAIADAMIDGKYSTNLKIEDHPQIKKWREDNERDKKLLDGLLKDRDKRNRERRRSKTD